MKGDVLDWVAVGLQMDVPHGTVVPRKVRDIDLAVWCSRAGVYHVWGDRCPHRGMRLSHGFVRGETLACIYHGWQYDQNGSCAYIPAHPNLTPPKTICATSHTCRTQEGIIWVAFEPTAAPPPETGGRVPVRSLEVSRSAPAIAADIGHDLSPLIVLGGSHDLAIALQPSSDDRTFLHAFTGAGRDRKAASRALEDLRCDLEGAG
ncbi:MAG: Rieske 2Fe-2S domain-containing protein [Pseudomonadota bacterium]